MSDSESVVVHAYRVVRVSPLTEYLNIVSDKLYSSSYTVCKVHQSSKIRLNLKTVHMSKKFEGWMNCSMYSYMGKCIVYLVCSIVASIMVASWGATGVNQESDERKTTEPSLQYNYTMRLILWVEPFSIVQLISSENLLNLLYSTRELTNHKILTPTQHLNERSWIGSTILVQEYINQLITMHIGELSISNDTWTLSWLIMSSLWTRTSIGWRKALMSGETVRWCYQ